MRKKWQKYDKLEDALLVKIRAILDRTTDTKELTSLKKLDVLQTNLQDKTVSLVLKSFTLYQKMLSTTLSSEWDNIVHEHFFTAG